MAKASFYSSTGVTSTNINAIEDSKNAAAASATQAEASKVAAAQSASDANAAKLAAQTAQTDAEDAETNSAASATAAAASAASAATSLAGIGNSETNAATSASNSATSASAAAASALSASSSATSAASDAASAATSLSNIGSAEANAAASATSAASSASTASTDAASASASQVAAAASEAAAATSEANSATSETNAATSASQAATSAANSATSETNAATSASSASTSASNAASSASAASASQVAAAASAASAANAYDTFDDRYLGSKTADPTVDNDGNALVQGSLYFNSTANEMRVYDGGSWIAASSAGGASLLEYKYTATAAQTTFSGADDNANTLSYTQDNLIVTLNGVVLENGADYTATTGTSVVLASGAAANDELNVIAFKSFTTADMVSSANGGTFYNNIDVQGTVTADGLTVDGNATINDNFPYILLNESDTTDLNTRISVGSGYFNLNTLDDAYTAAKQRFRLDNSTGDISFYEDTGTTAKFFWDASAESLGIGTTDPYVGGVTGNGSLNVLHSTAGQWVMQGRANVAGANGLFIRAGDTSSDTTALFTGRNEANVHMKIDGSGQVGIGTSSPTAQLHLSSADASTVIHITDASGYGEIANSNGSLYLTADRGNAGSKFMSFRVGGTSEAARIDESGNLLVGKTASSLANDGFQVHNTGYIGSTNSGASTAYFNRKTNDGDIVNFQKDGTAVGSIGVEGGDVTIGKAGSGLQFRSADPCVRPHNMTTNSPSDAAVDLGRSNTRFKDLYLSGGVYLGGTGASNQLDDYEEGTWTPTLFAGGTQATLEHQGAGDTQGVYTKIGRQVTIHAEIDVNNLNGGVGLISIQNLPFGVADLLYPTGIEASGSVSYWNVATALSSMSCYANSADKIEFEVTTSGTLAATVTMNNTHLGTGEFRFTITYFTN